METPSAICSVRRLGQFMVGVAMVTASPALAQMASPAPLSPTSQMMSRASQILGGAPSHLQLLMQAQTRTGASITPSFGSIATAAAAPIDRSLVYRAILTDPELPLGDPPIAEPPPGDPPAAEPSAAEPAAAEPAASEPVSQTRPDVFGSVALDIAHTPLDARLASIAGGSAGTFARRFATGLRGHGAMARIEAVNAYVNRRVEFMDDARRFGVADRWSTGAETLASGRGDCEDYAIAKMEMLRDAGLADRDLILVVLKDVSRRADHAVLVVRVADRFVVLDNGTDRLFDSTDLRDYRPVFSFTAGHRYLHGFRREARPAPVTYASADPVRIDSIAPIASAAGGRDSDTATTSSPTAL